MSTASQPPVDRVLERRRAAALARHYRDVEHLSIAEIASRLGRRPATVKAYLYDPTGERAREVKARYRGTCEICGASTSGGDGKNRARRFCSTHQGEARRIWTQESALAAMLAWNKRYGPPPTSSDWSRAQAQRRGGEALARLAAGAWPSAETVRALFGSWTNARAELDHAARRSALD